MNKDTNESKGITLIALIISIILILILMSTAIFTGYDAYHQARVTRFTTRMQLLQAKIDELVENIENAEEIAELGLALVDENTYEEQKVIEQAFNSGEITTKDNFYIFEKDDIKNKLDIDEIQNNIMVNFNTREIVNLKGIEYEGYVYYTQYNLPNGQKIINGNSSDRNLSFDIEKTMDGLNCIVSIKNISISNGTLRFEEMNADGNLTGSQIITNYTENGKEYNVNISKSGDYKFTLNDNTNTENRSNEKTVKIMLANKPKTKEILKYDYGENSSKWAYMQKNNVEYVWIPRFVYNSNNNIKFVKGNSNIATDETYISNWTVHNKFTAKDGTELTGVWVSVDNKNNIIQNMIELLNNNNHTILTEI